MRRESVILFVRFHGLLSGFTQRPTHRCPVGLFGIPPNTLQNIWQGPPAGTIDGFLFHFLIDSVICGNRYCLFCNNNSASLDRVVGTYNSIINTLYTYYVSIIYYLYYYNTYLHRHSTHSTRDLHTKFL